MIFILKFIYIILGMKNRKIFNEDDINKITTGRREIQLNKLYFIIDFYLLLLIYILIKFYI